MKSIGIDIGTTTISLVVFENECVLEKTNVNSNSFIKDTKTQDVNKILNIVLSALDNYLNTYHDIYAIGLTGQMHGIVYVDKLGKAISPLYTWQDQSGQSIVDELNRSLKHKVASGYGLVTYTYHQQNHLVPKDAYKICTIMDYVGMVLTQRKEPLVHVSNAASFGFWDLENQCFEIVDEILPKVTKNIEELGCYKGIPVYVALGDNQASFLGSVGLNSETVLLNMGTGGQVSVLTNTYQQIPGVEIRPFINNSYLLVGASLCGGRAYAILENFLRSYVKEATGIDESQYETMERLSKKVENHLHVITTFNGTRTDENQLACISNISEAQFLPEFLIRGFMVGMIEELYEMYLKMNQKAKKLVVSGNGFRKNETLQNIAKTMFDVPLILSSFEEEAAVGAAISYQYSSR